MSRVVRCSAVLMLVLGLGLQWTLLQSVAWVSMVVTYSRDGSLIEALVKTFDGQHPCSLCKVVQSGKKSDKQQQQARGTGKDFDLYLEPAGQTCLTEHSFMLPAASDSSAPVRSERPPLPPPRCA